MKTISVNSDPFERGAEIALSFVQFRTERTESHIIVQKKLLTMGNLAFQELIIIGLVVVLPLIALIDILRSNFREGVNKIVWVLVVLLLPVLGTILYFVIGRNQKAV